MPNRTPAVALIVTTAWIAVASAARAQTPDHPGLAAAAAASAAQAGQTLPATPVKKSMIA